MKQVLTYWHVDTFSIVLLLCTIGWYALVTRFKNKQGGYFIAALINMFICFFSPLSVLASNYLFSMHMAVHVLLLLICGPLLLLSLPTDGKYLPFFFKHLQQHPLTGWITGVGIMWLWHIPILFNATMNHHSGFLGIVRMLENTSLLLAGILFSAPVFHPHKAYRMEPLQGVIYLFTACVSCSILGLLITFAPIGTYHHYLSMDDPYYLNEIIVSVWGISRIKDQQAAGLIMWVPCCFLYVSGAMYLLASSLQQKEELSIATK